MVDFDAWLRFDFTDEQWSKLVNLSGGMPDDARAEFEKSISDYLWERRSDPTAAKNLRDESERVRKKVVGVLNDREWKFAAHSLDWALDINAFFGRPPSIPFGKTLDALLNLLANRLALRNSQMVAGASRPGPKSSQASYRFVASAVAIFEKYKHQPATRSNKRGKSLNFQDFIKNLCAIADPAITPSTIDGALKRIHQEASSKAPW